MADGTFSLQGCLTVACLCKCAAYASFVVEGFIVAAVGTSSACLCCLSSVGHMEDSQAANVPAKILHPTGRNSGEQPSFY